MTLMEQDTVAIELPEQNRLPISEIRLLDILEHLSRVSGYHLALTDHTGQLVAKTEEFPPGVLLESDPLRLQAHSVEQMAVDFGPDFSSVWYLLAVQRLKGQISPTRVLASSLEEIVRTELAHEKEIESMSREILSRYEEVNLFYDLSDELASVFKIDKIVRIVLRKAQEILFADAAWIFLADTEEDELTLARKHIKTQIEAEAYEKDIFTLCTWSFLYNQAFLIECRDDLIRQAAEYDVDYQVQFAGELSAIISPIFVKDRRLGVMAIARFGAGESYTGEDMKLMTAISSMGAVAIYNGQLIEKVKKEEVARKELEIASTIQRNLLPAEIPFIPGVELASKYLAANKVGGDYLDYLLDERGNLYLVIADVSGHNIGAGILMASSRSVIRMNILAQRSPAEILEMTNKVLYDDLDRSDLFLSAMVCRYEPASRMLELANAGHNPAYLWRAQEQQGYWINSDHFFIGLERNFEMSSQTLRLTAGDLLVLYTDGLVEATNTEGERYEMKRLAQAIQANSRLSASELIDYLSRDVQKFMKHTHFDDDISVLILKIIDESSTL